MSEGITFGGWLRERRKELGVTQEDLAERVGCALPTLQKIESGERRPSGQIANLLADYCRIPADERDAFVAFARTGHVITLAQDGASYSEADPSRTPWRKAYARRTNLPATLTPLIGREEEVSALGELIRHSKTRLVTLTGAPGIGKTRLALQAASDLLAHFEDGVILVELAPVVEPALVPITIANTLGLRETAGMPIESALLAHVRERRMLLLLDNFEQVLDAALSVVNLLESSPWLKVLVTSREPLRVRGERRFAVPPLAVPSARDEVSGKLGTSSLALGAYSSVELFVERARMSAPDFRLTDLNVGAVAQVCSALDGLPLAIELAAGHVSFLEPHEIEARLGSRLHLLRSGARDLPARQRTLRRAIEWSYNLLDVDEQALFRRLGVFVRGYTPAAAAAVAWPEGRGESAQHAELEVAQHLERLLDKSMITRADGMRGTSRSGNRLGMLETLREYALEQLAECGEEEETRDRHARYYLTLIQEGSEGEHIIGPDVVPWLELVRAEHDNLNEALGWLLGGEGISRYREREIERVELAARLCSELFPFWNGQNFVSEARAWYTKAAARITALVEATSYREEGKSSVSAARELSPDLPVHWARMVVGTGIMAYYQGDYEEARALNEQGLALRRELGDKSGVSACLNNLGMSATEQGDYAAARDYLQESLAVARETVIPWRIYAALTNLGLVELKLGNFAEARSLLEEAVRPEGEFHTPVDALNHLGLVARLQGNYVEARGHLEESLRLSRERGDRGSSATTLVELGFVAMGEGDYATARRLFQEGLPIAREEGDKKLMVQYLGGLAYVMSAADDMIGLERAARLYGAAEALREGIKLPLAPVEQEEYDRYLHAARASFDDASWRAIYEQGRGMTLEEAVEAGLRQD